MRMFVSIRFIKISFLVAWIFAPYFGIANNSSLFEVSIDSLKSLLDKGVLLKEQLKYEEAVNVFNQVVYESKKVEEDSIQFVALQEICRLGIDRGKNVESLNAALEQLKLADQYPTNLAWNVVAINNVGRGYYYIGQKQKSLQYFIKAAEDSKAINHKKRGTFLSNIGAIYLEMDVADSSLIYLNQAIEILEQGEDYKQLTTAYILAGQTWLLKFKDYEKAYKYHIAAIAVAEKHQLYYDLVFAYSRMGRYYFEIENYLKSLQWNIKAFELNREKLKSKDQERMIYRDRAQLYAKLKEPDSTYKYMVLSNQLGDSIYRNQTAHQVAKMEVLYETQKKELQLIQTQGEVKMVKLEVSKRNTQIILLFVSILLLFSIGVIIFFRIKEKQKIELAEVRIAEQKNSIKAIIEAQENERQVIAKDLHDGVGQTLSALKMRLMSLGGNSSSEQDVTNGIVKSVEITTEAYEELRSISHQMMPATLKQYGLQQALHQMLRRTLAKTEMSFEFNETTQGTRYEKIVELSLYRICQELVSNIIKHSKCTKIDFQVFENHGNLIIMVEDDGVGFEPKTNSLGIGLQNIYSRAEVIDAIISIQSGQFEGTLVVIKTPIQP